VYLATRSESKTADVIKDIQTKHPSAKGELVFLKLELDDLTTIKKSAEEFLSKEKKLDVLFLNAGVMVRYVVGTGYSAGVKLE
jgi:NADP-dependent 3-hydroxy acid dehydrogenase YdfG